MSNAYTSCSLLWISSLGDGTTGQKSVENNKRTEIATT